RNRKGAKEGLERGRHRMFEQPFDRRLLQTELAKQLVKLRDARAEVRLVGELPRLPRQDERVLQREARRFADELREEALEAGGEGWGGGDEGGHGVRTRRPSPSK